MFFQKFPRNSSKKQKNYDCNAFTANPEKLSRENGKPQPKTYNYLFSLTLWVFYTIFLICNVQIVITSASSRPRIAEIAALILRKPPPQQHPFFGTILLLYLPGRKSLQKEKNHHPQLFLRTGKKLLLWMPLKVLRKTLRSSPGISF